MILKCVFKNGKHGKNKISFSFFNINSPNCLTRYDPLIHNPYYTSEISGLFIEIRKPLTIWLCLPSTIKTLISIKKNAYYLFLSLPQDVLRTVALK